MQKNINKGEAYHLFFSKIKLCNETSDIFHLIGLTAATESIMSDRLSSFLLNIRRNNYKNGFVLNSNSSFAKLLLQCKVHLEVSLKINSKDGVTLQTQNLFDEIWEWKEKRNEVVHAICKSKKNVSHKNLQILFSEALYSCQQGHNLLRLLLKWSKQNN